MASSADTGDALLRLRRAELPALLRPVVRRARRLTGHRSGPLAWLDGFDEYGQLCRARLDHVVAVREPLVVVSQVPRSGGTLLSQLLDGHPECHAHPSEINIGKPRFWEWPPLELDRPERWFETLFEKKVVTHLVRGYGKTPKYRPDREVFPFLFLPRLQRAIFERCVAEWRPGSEREVLDCYFTSYFNAWLDNQNLYARPKRVVTGFWPRFVMKKAAAGRFFAAYPEGMLISVVRDPRAWYRSAVRWLDKYRDVELAMGKWRHSTEAALRAREQFGEERVLVLTYEALVRETEATMALVAERIGIAFSPVLLEPTFNGQPIRANSSDPVSEYGVLADRVEAWREDLDAATIARVEELAGDLYDRADALGRERSAAAVP